MIRKILLFVLTTFILTSCNSNDDSVDVSVTEALLVGEWNVVGFESDVKTKTSFNGETINSTITTTGKDFNFVYTFTQNPNLITSKGSYTSVTTISSQGETETLTNENISSVDGLDSGSWTLNGNIITLNINDNTEEIPLEGINLENINKAEIIEFSEKTMKIKVDANQKVSDNEIGFKIDLDIEMFLTFERK